MIAQTITPDLDPCQLAEKWMISPQLARGLLRMVELAPFQIQIISGFRTAAQQQELIAAGKGAAVEVSTHTSCPATGADLWPLVSVTNVVKATFGSAATYAGLRWGGGSTPDPETGIPADWNHVDLGPRSR